MHIFELNQVVRLKNTEFIGVIIDVAVDRNNNTIYQLRVPQDNINRWYLAKDLELVERVIL